MNDDALRLLEYEEMKDLFLPAVATVVGKEALRALRPSRNADAVDRRLSEVREVLALFDRGVRVPFGGIRDLGPLLASARTAGRPMEPDELASVFETLSGARRISAAADGWRADHPDLEIPRVLDLAGQIPGFTSLCDRIDRILDERGKVRDEASTKLADIRVGIRGTRERIDSRVSRFLQRKDLRNILQDMTPRFRSGRLVLAIKAERRGEIRGILHGVSQSGATCFIEPEEVVSEGNSLEDLLARERREVTRILWEATVRVLEVENEIRDLLSAVARLDLAQASATTVAEQGLCVPERNDRGVVRFRRARHPLLVGLLGAENVVPVDLRLGDDFHLLVVTGPNTGGKTVTLKTLGLLVLMAQSGLPVPAEEAEFSRFDDVFVDVGDEQSLQQSLSTFSGHVKRIARFLAAANGRTLILLDELGSGTDPAEGAALGRAILDYLHEREVPAAVTTHLGSLKTYAFTNEGVENASVEFDVETLSPTFRLLMGQAGASNALIIADRLGLPSEIVARAEGFVNPGEKAVREVLDSAQAIRTRAEKKLSEAENLRVDSRAIREKAEDELREAEERRQHVEREAEEEMEESLLRFRRLVADFVKDMANAPKPFGEKAKELGRRADEEVRATPLGRKREEFARSLSRGDEVYVPRLKEKFLVHQVKKKDRKLVVLKGSLRMEIAFDDVTWV